jgi:hypothetical protein
MKRTTHWLVADAGIRPEAGAADRCFFCDQPQGQEHAEGCNIRERIVVVRFVADLVVSVPEHWTPELVDFKFGGGAGWCGSTLAEIVTAAADQAHKGGRCLCGVVTGTFQREATTIDEERQNCFVNKLPA